MQKARGQAFRRFHRHRPPTACRQTVSGSLSLPSPGFFSPFPHGTRSLSVAGEYLALEGGPPGFQRDCTCPVVLGYLHQGGQRAFVYGTVTLSGGRSHDLRLAPDLLTPRATPHAGPATPQSIARLRFRLWPVRSPLLRPSRLISCPRGTEMFQFPRFACADLCIQSATSGHDPAQVPPFGYPRISACLRLPEAFRSLPRPSSLPGAKASSVRP
jgi:hypothetical protein